MAQTILETPIKVPPPPCQRQDEDDEYLACVQEGLRDYERGALYSNEVAEQQAAERRARILAGMRG